MDQHDLKPSALMNDVRHLCSPKEHDCFGEANSLSDCCGTCINGNAGVQKQDHEISGGKADKLPEMERNYSISSTSCSRENADDLSAPSSVISTMKDSVLEKENRAEGTSAVISNGNRLEVRGI